MADREFPRVATTIDHQHQRREAAQQAMRDIGQRFGERQRKLLRGRALCRPGKLLPDRDGERHRAAIAAGPGIGVGAEAVNARQEVGGHADIAVPDIVEPDLADLWP